MRLFMLHTKKMNRHSWVGLPVFLSFFLALMLLVSSLHGTWGVAYASHCGTGTGVGSGTGTVAAGSAVGTAPAGQSVMGTVAASPSSLLADGVTTSILTATVNQWHVDGDIPLENVTVFFRTTLGTVSTGTASATATASTAVSVETLTNSSGVATAILLSGVAGSATVDAKVVDDAGTATLCPQTTLTFTAPPPDESGSSGGGASPAPATPAPTVEPTVAPTVAPTAEPTPEPTPEPVTQTVDQGGGTVDIGGGATTDGGTTLEIPHGALDTPADITISITNEPPPGVEPPPGGELGNKTIEISLPAEATLEQAAFITVNLIERDLQGRDILEARLGRVAADNTLEPIPTDVPNPEDLVIRGRLDGFSKFALFFATKTAPTLLEPVDGIILPTLGRVLKWTNPPDTKWFQIQVIPFNKDGPGIDLIIGDAALVQAAQYEVKAPNFGAADPNYVMLPSMSYQWQVRTATSDTSPTNEDWSLWSVRTLRTTSVGSGSISLQSPVDQSVVDSTGPTLTWANSDKLVFYYEVQVSADPTFSRAAGAPPLYWNLIHGGVSTPPNSYVIPSSSPLQSGTIYYWRVRPRIQGDGTPVGWTLPRSFTTP